jgi:hypothetical protein
VRELTEEERGRLEVGPRSPDAFVVRRCQMLLADPAARYVATVPGMRYVATVPGMQGPDVAWIAELLASELYIRLQGYGAVLCAWLVQPRSGPCIFRCTYAPGPSAATTTT